MVGARRGLGTDAWADRAGLAVPRQQVSTRHRSGSRKPGGIGPVAKPPCRAHSPQSASMRNDCGRWAGRNGKLPRELKGGPLPEMIMT